MINDKENYTKMLMDLIMFVTLLSEQKKTPHLTQHSTHAAGD